MVLFEPKPIAVRSGWTAQRSAWALRTPATAPLTKIPHSEFRIPNFPMPTYDYVCDACGHTWDEFQSITAKPTKKCPECGKLKAKRKIGAGAGIIFRGSGFYQTDYRSDSYKKAAEADTKSQSSSESKTESKSESKSDSKPSSKDSGGKGKKE